MLLHLPSCNHELFIHLTPEKLLIAFSLSEEPQTRSESNTPMHNTVGSTSVQSAHPHPHQRESVSCLLVIQKMVPNVPSVAMAFLGLACLPSASTVGLRCLGLGQYSILIAVDGLKHA